MYLNMLLHYVCDEYIGGVMVKVLASSALDCRIEPRFSQTNVYEIGICRFSARHVALRRKGKDWLARNQDPVSEWELMFQ